MNGVRAAVDVGSNSVRLLVVGADGRELERRVEITRLAAGVDDTGHLDDAALERTLAVVEEYRRAWTGHGAVHVRIAATSAVRDAADRDRFTSAVRTSTGVDVEVLTGAQEAALAHAGATAALRAPTPTAVVDVGGGSTEIVIGDTTRSSSVSLQLGSVRLTERCLADDPPTAAQVQAARRQIGVALDEGLPALAVPLDRARALVAVAGTATTLAAVGLGLKTYDRERVHGAHLSLDALESLTARLLGCDADGRRQLGPVQPGREQVLHAGAMILVEVVRRSGVDPILVSEADSLDGLVAS